MLSSPEIASAIADAIMIVRVFLIAAMLVALADTHSVCLWRDLSGDGANDVLRRGRLSAWKERPYKYAGRDLTSYA